MITNLAKLRDIKERVDEASQKEKNARPPFYESTISLARRPLITSRFALLLSLAEDLDPKDVGKILGLDSKKPFEHNPPKLFKGIIVLDPFAGGGAIPLEAARLGAKAIALDYSPVQWAVLKVIEIAQRRRDLLDIKMWESLKKKYRRGFDADMEKMCNDPDHVKAGPLLAESCKIYKELKNELVRYYPDYNGKKVKYYFWAKQVKCPKCGAWVPLVYDFSLEPKRGIGWRPIYNNGDYVAEIGEPAKRTIEEGDARCPKCNYSIPKSYIRANIKGNDRLVIIMAEDKNFYPADRAQSRAYESVPEPERLEEELAPNDPRSVVPPLYGYTKFGDLFNKRQHFYLNKLTEKIKAINDPDLKTVLAWLIPRQADRNSVLSTWDKSKQGVRDALANKVLSMVWDYVETNPFVQTSGSLLVTLYDIIDGFAFLLRATEGTEPIEVMLGSATELPFPDKSVKYVVTDPPYYDNIPYPESYDFAYVWLKRVLADIYPDVFKFWTLWRDRSDLDISVGGNRTSEHFELLLEKAFKEIRRVLTDDGVLSLYFAHSKREAWIAILNTLHKAGFEVVNVIPVKSESKTDIQGRGKISLLTSVIITAKPRGGDAGVAYVEKLRPLLAGEVKRAVREAWAAGFRGVDLLVHAYGRALSIATKYSELKALRGNAVESVINVAEEVAHDAVLEELLGALKLDNPTRFYVLAVRGYGGVMDGDTFLSLSRLTASKEELRRMRLVKEQSSTVVLVDFHDRCDKATSQYYIDQLHRLLCAFDRGGFVAVQRLLTNTPLRLDIVCKLAEIIYSSRWSSERSKEVNSFIYAFCGKQLKDGLLNYT